MDAPQTETSSPSPEPAAGPRPRARGVKQVLLGGVFWRILIIEAILLLGSVAYRAWFHGAAGEELLWYAVRIMLLVAVIILFMWLTLSVFLKERIIAPLEAIAEANRKLENDDPAGREVELPARVPKEIREIADSRRRMVATITRIADERLRLVNFIKKTFGRYLSDKVVDEILSSPHGLHLGGRRQEVTILMADLRGFTTLVADRDPEDMMELINRYLDRMSRVILSYDGVIDEFIGDAILVVFGMPRPQPDDPARAVACALAMQNALAELNQEMSEPLEMGIAVNTGTVLVGNIGSEQRLKYGVVGAPVSMAARLESTTVGGQVVIGQATYEAVRDLVTTAPARTHMMKGFSQPVVSHPVLAMGPPYNLRLPAEPQASELVPLEMPVTAWLVEDKEVSARAIPGTSLALGKSLLAVRLKEELAPGDNLKLHIDLCAEAHCFGDIYAKVLEVEASPRGPVHRLRITAISAEDRQVLKRWRQEVS